MASAETGTPSLGERYRVLLEIGRTLTGTLSPEDLYRAIYRETARVVEAAGFYISLYDADTDLATIVFYADKGEESRCDITYRGTESEVIRTGQATVVEDRLEAQSLMLLGDKDSEITRSAISAPLRYKGRVIGAISTQSYRPRAYSRDDLELLQGIADLAAVAVENARQFRELELRRREAERIEEIGRALTGSLDFDEVLAKVTAATMDLLNGDGASVWMIEGTLATAKASTGPILVPVGTRWDIAGPLYERLVRQRTYATIEDLSTSDLVPQHLRGIVGAGSGLAVPLQVGDAVAGALAVGSSEPRAFSGDDIRVLQRLAGQASVALDNAQLHANVQALSLTDALTGLPNRRHLQIHLEREVAAARRGRKLSLVLFDLDDFKHYNDTLGHVVGDQILKAFARVLEDENRAMNMVARFGGDEFVSVLSESDQEGAEGYIRRINQRVAADRILAPHGVTVSSGIAVFSPDRMVGVEELIQTADRNMYREKDSRTRH
ncbi:MAG: GGDEF domain-containing protein [Gemmatimonadetes bacterium]|nr:MAG: GGDEF domain-containing protein [Gemmatimonadota bacterium]